MEISNITIVKQKKSSWLAAHIYFQGNVNQFILEVVKKIRDHVLKDHLATNYFFIRYWEKGQHIRLRFLGKPDILENEVKNVIEEYSADFFKRNPIILSKNNAVSESSRISADSLETNKVYYFEYLPEIERYGGDKGILIAEEQFELSSEVVLSLLSRFENKLGDWDDSSIAFAVQLHLAVLNCFGFDKTDVSEFMSIIMNDWIPSIKQPLKSTDRENYNDMNDDSLNAYIISLFEIQSEKVEPILKPFIEEFWSSLEMNFKYEEDWLNMWINGLNKIHNRYKVNIDENIIIPELRHKYNGPLSDEKYKIGYILKSHIHMTNNRLGVLNHNESYIAFLIKKYIK